MVLELAPLRDCGDGADPSPHIVDIGLEDVLVRAEFEALLGAREPWIKVRVIDVEMVQVCEHEDAVIVCQVEVVVGIPDVSSFLVIVPLLIWITFNKLFHVTVNTWVVNKVRIMHPSFIFASQNQVKRGWWIL